MPIAAKNMVASCRVDPTITGTSAAVPSVSAAPGFSGSTTASRTGPNAPIVPIGPMGAPTADCAASSCSTGIVSRAAKSGIPELIQHGRGHFGGGVVTARLEPRPTLDDRTVEQAARAGIARRVLTL